MEEIMAKINSLEFTNEENLKEIIENIMELEESKEDALKEFIKKIREELVKDVVVNLTEKSEINNYIENLKTILEDNSELDSLEINKLFDEQDLEANKVLEEVFEQINTEIQTLEEELSYEIEKAEEEQKPVDIYIEEKIEELEKEKSEQVKQYNEMINSIKEELQERNLFITEKDLIDKIAKLEEEQEEIYHRSGGYPSVEDEKRYHEINKIKKDIEKEIEYRNSNSGKSNEELNKEFEKYTKEQEELSSKGVKSEEQAKFRGLEEKINYIKLELEKRERLQIDSYSNEYLEQQIKKLENDKEQLKKLGLDELSERDQSKYREINELINKYKKELEKRKQNPAREYSTLSIDELEKLLDKYLKEQKNIQSTYDKKVEDLKVKLKKSHRLENLKKYKGNKIEKKEKAKQLAVKSLVAIAGFGTGLVLSSVPGVGVIRTMAATTKLAASGINVWTKKFPEGKVAKLVSSTKEKFENEFGDKINNFEEKYPKIASAVKVTKDKIKQILSNEKVNLFINGVSAGYVVGNVVELVTGKTVLEHAGDMFDNDVPAPIVETPSETLTQTAPEIDMSETTQIVPEATPIAPEAEFTLEKGVTYDLSGIEEGFVSSDAAQSVDLMSGPAENVTFDRIVNGRAHFIQSNGNGMAWYDLEDVQEYLSSAGKVK